MQSNGQGSPEAKAFSTPSKSQQAITQIQETKLATTTKSSLFARFKKNFYDTSRLDHRQKQMFSVVQPLLTLEEEGSPENKKTTETVLEKMKEIIVSASKKTVGSTSRLNTIKEALNGQTLLIYFLDVIAGDYFGLELVNEVLTILKIFKENGADFQLAGQDGVSPVMYLPALFKKLELFQSTKNAYDYRKQFLSFFISAPAKEEKKTDSTSHSLSLSSISVEFKTLPLTQKSKGKIDLISILIKDGLSLELSSEIWKSAIQDFLDIGCNMKDGEAGPLYALWQKILITVDDSKDPEKDLKKGLDLVRLLVELGADPFQVSLRGQVFFTSFIQAWIKNYACIDKKPHPSMVLRKIPNQPTDWYEVPVLHNNTSGLHSIILSMLIESVSDSKKFHAVYGTLFAEKDNKDEGIDGREKRIMQLLLRYDGNPNFLSEEGAVIERLIEFNFRPKLAEFMKKNGEKNSKYIEALRQPKTAIDEKAINQVGLLLNRNIIILKLDKDGLANEPKNLGKKDAKEYCHLIELIEAKQVYYHYLTQQDKANPLTPIKKSPVPIIESDLSDKKDSQQSPIGNDASPGKPELESKRTPTKLPDGSLASSSPGSADKVPGVSELSPGKPNSESVKIGLSSDGPLKIAYEETIRLLFGFKVIPNYFIEKNDLAVLFDEYPKQAQELMQVLLRRNLKNDAGKAMLRALLVVIEKINDKLKLILLDNLNNVPDAKKLEYFSLVKHGFPVKVYDKFAQNKYVLKYVTEVPAFVSLYREESNHYSGIFLYELLLELAVDPRYLKDWCERLKLIREHYLASFNSHEDWVIFCNNLRDSISKVRNKIDCNGDLIKKIEDIIRVLVPLNEDSRNFLDKSRLADVNQIFEIIEKATDGKQILLQLNNLHVKYRETYPKSDTVVTQLTQILNLRDLNSLCDYIKNCEVDPTLLTTCQNGKLPINQIMSTKKYANSMSRIVKELKDIGADLDAVDDFGHSPLSHSLKEEFWPAASALLEHGADETASFEAVSFASSEHKSEDERNFMSVFLEGLKSDMRECPSRIQDDPYRKKVFQWFLSGLRAEHSLSKRLDKLSSWFKSFGDQPNEKAQLPLLITQLFRRESEEALVFIPNDNVVKNMATCLVKAWQPFSLFHLNMMAVNLHQPGAFVYSQSGEGNEGESAKNSELFDERTGAIVNFWHMNPQFLCDEILREKNFFMRAAVKLFRSDSDYINELSDEYRVRIALVFLQTRDHQYRDEEVSEEDAIVPLSVQQEAYFKRCKLLQNKFLSNNSKVLEVFWTQFAAKARYLSLDQVNTCIIELYSCNLQLGFDLEKEIARICELNPYEWVEQFSNIQNVMFMSYVAGKPIHEIEKDFQEIEKSSPFSLNKMIEGALDKSLSLYKASRDKTVFWAQNLYPARPENVRKNSIVELAAKCKQYANNLTSDDNRTEYFAALDLLIYYTFISKNMRPYHAQMITFIGIQSGLKKGMNVLGQVGTGQGKSLLIAMLASYIALNGKKVDVVETSKDLAMRDAAFFQPFFEALSLTVSGSAYTGRDVISDANVVYDEYENFPIRESYRQAKLFEMKPAENKQVVNKGMEEKTGRALIIDETDIFMSDKASHSFSLNVVDLPGMENLLKIIWNKIKVSKNTFVDREKIRTSVTSAEEYKNLPEVSVAYCNRFMDQLIQNAFAVKAEVNCKNIINESGEIEWDQALGRFASCPTVYSFGATQFRQLKRNITPGASQLAVSRIVYGKYFKGYDCLVGLSGTLGSESERKYDHTTFKAKSFDTPNFANRALVKKDPEFFEGEALWRTQIIKSAIECSKQSRPVLVILETPEQVKAFSEALPKEMQDLSQQLLGDKTASIIDQQVKAAVKLVNNCGMITFTTPFGGRGQDYKVIDQIIDDKGGMVVITGHFPESERIQTQYEGRTARQDKKGLAMMMLNKQDCFLFMKRAGMEVKDTGIYQGKEGEKLLWEDLKKARLKLLANNMEKKSHADSSHEYSKRFFESLEKTVNRREGLKARWAVLFKAIDSELVSGNVEDEFNKFLKEEGMEQPWMP